MALDTISQVRDIKTCKADFVSLQQKVHGHQLVYLDSAATAQQPTSVVSAMVDFIQNDYANTHGRIHALSERSQKHLDDGRANVANFIGAKDSQDVVFTHSATCGLNLVVNSYFSSRLQADDVVVTTILEHHSNFVPWQQLCQKTGAKLEVVPLVNHELDLEYLETILINKQPTVLAITHVSNVLGLENPLKEIIALAHKHDCLVVVDGAQAVGHVEVDVVDLDCDFYVFSGHKMYAPTGIGVVYAKQELWPLMQPWVVGGGMVATVDLDHTVFLPGVEAFEAGTKNVIGVVGMSAAIDYINQFGIEQIKQHEKILAKYLYDNLIENKKIRILGGANRSALISFVIDEIHPHDLVMLLDQQGVACRGGHHCAQPLLRSYGVTSSSRVSCAMYSDEADIDAFLLSLNKACEVLGV